MIEADKQQLAKGGAVTRERITGSMLDLVLERGYEATTVEAVIERAEVASADFERHFAGKQDCCLQIYLANNALFDEQVRAAFESHERWRDSLRAAAYAAADFFVEHPRRVRFNMVAVFGAGELLVAQRDAYLRDLTSLIDAGRQELADPESVSRGVAESVIGSVFERVLRDTHRGAFLGDPRAVVPDLMYIAVRPYLGHEAAVQELSIPPPLDQPVPPAPRKKRPSGTKSRTPVQFSHTTSYLASMGNGEGPKDADSGLPRLPPGRHGLPRSFVVQNQRDRLTAGIIAAVAQHGYNETTISQIAAAAGVSRRTFYAYFSSKQDCYLATYDVISLHLGAATRAAAESCEAWPERVRAQLGAALEFFASNPDLVRFYLIAPLRAGEEVATRYREGASRVLAELTNRMPPHVDRPSLTVEQALAGGIAGLIVSKVESGEGKRLAELLPDLIELFLSPFIGREAAVRVARGPMGTC